MTFVQQNGRNIPKEDKIFAINGRAKARVAELGKQAVANATIGALLDDEGDLIVMQSITDAIATLAPEDYAEYAPIGGLPGFKEAVKQALFGSFKSSRILEVCATPGGTGAIRNAVSNYTRPGDKVLTCDWFWAGYTTIVGELGRSVATFEMFTPEGNFAVDAFAAKAAELMEEQGDLLVILNTPAHNPTGYSLTEADWAGVTAALDELSAKGPVVLLIDAAYIDFAGDEEEYRQFFRQIEELGDGVLPLVAYSASKTLTLYGMRTGALVCMAGSGEVAQEFRSSVEYSSRGSWSNGVRAGQVIMDKVYNDPALMAKVAEERAFFRDMLIRRGKAFERTLREQGIEPVPFDAGFFASVPMPNPDEVAAELEKENIFLIPLAKGIRTSVASVPKDKCALIPARIKACMEKLADK